mmetsp:Transcript_15782/g.31132  ORF Transcript_15782/g.31132 Transcript_15782/m.31132 type:complete len:209 (-) Transcript_15782:3-629(-)
MKMVEVVTRFKKPRSCDTMTTVRSHSVRKDSSQVHANTSRWLVGSSSSSRSGLTKSACARDIRILQPPENSLVGCLIMSGSKPRPERITAALLSALSLSNSSSRSYTSCSEMPASSSVTTSSHRSFSIFSSHSLSLSACRIVSSALRSSPRHSCSTWITYMNFGTSTCLHATARKNVDFPTPLRPTMPYFVPYVSFSTPRSISSSSRT